MNTKTQTFQMHLYFYETLGRFELYSCKGLETSHLFYVGPVKVDVPVPVSFDVRSVALAAKQAELTKVRAEFTKRITDLTRQINELQAIELAGAIPAKEAA